MPKFAVISLADTIASLKRNAINKTTKAVENKGQALQYLTSFRLKQNYINAVSMPAHCKPKSNTLLN
jgi:hypothetical protein